VSTLLNNGLLRNGELADKPDDAFTDGYIYIFFLQFQYISNADGLFRERREHRIFNILLQMIPGILERLMEASAEEIVHIGELVSCNLILDLVKVDSGIDTERLRRCEIGRYQELERGNPRLDRAHGPAPEPSIGTQHQG
jgi:hypothetical protein